MKNRDGISFYHDFFIYGKFEKKHLRLVVISFEIMSSLTFGENTGYILFGCKCMFCEAVCMFFAVK